MSTLVSDVRGIIIEFLTANGYDGLADDECGCGIDNLAPWGTCIPLDCEPAYRWRCAAGCHRLKDEGEGCIMFEGRRLKDEGEGCWRPEPQLGEP